ncbi:MAG: hypothetical protein J5825_01135 [Lachnospiraceae bacterium]|nr:hypothetical protein [Lachnospiraceae bacterium]
MAQDIKLVIQKTDVVKINYNITDIITQTEQPKIKITQPGIRVSLNPERPLEALVSVTVGLAVPSAEEDGEDVPVFTLETVTRVVATSFIDNLDKVVGSGQNVFIIVRNSQEKMRDILALTGTMGFSAPSAEVVLRKNDQAN